MYLARQCRSGMASSDELSTSCSKMEVFGVVLVDFGCDSVERGGRQDGLRVIHPRHFVDFLNLGCDHCGIPIAHQRP